MVAWNWGRGVLETGKQILTRFPRPKPQDLPMGWMCTQWKKEEYRMTPRLGVGQLDGW